MICQELFIKDFDLYLIKKGALNKHTGKNLLKGALNKHTGKNLLFPNVSSFLY